MKRIKIKEAVLEAAKRAFEEKLFAGTSGNLSVCDRTDETMAITPSGVDYRTMKLEEISLLTLDGAIVESICKPSSEWRMHAAIYRNLADVCAVIHTHSPYATAFAAIREGIPAILEEMIPYIGGDVLVSEFAPAGTEDLGVEALKVLRRRNACLLANHGALAVGRDIGRAYNAAIYLEDAAKVCAIARSFGEVKVLSAEAQNNIRRKYGLAEEP
jgi:L-ribulose-5-phosphate 4-epimerase